MLSPAIGLTHNPVISQILVNHSTSGRSRVDVPVTAVVKVDISAARAAILEAPGTVAGMLKDPPSAVVVKAIANVDLIIQALDLRCPKTKRPVDRAWGSRGVGTDDS